MTHFKKTIYTVGLLSLLVAAPAHAFSWAGFKDAVQDFFEQTIGGYTASTDFTGTPSYYGNAAIPQSMSQTTDMNKFRAWSDRVGGVHKVGDDAYGRPIFRANRSVYSGSATERVDVKGPKVVNGGCLGSTGCK